MARSRSTPVAGVPILDGVPQGRSDTPVSVAPVECDCPTSEQHAALVDEVTALRMEFVEHRTDVVGPRGDNGKHGTLKARVDRLERREWWAVSTAAAALLAAAIKIFIAGQEYGALRSEVSRLQEDVRELRVREHRTPAPLPDKEPSP